MKSVQSLLGAALACATPMAGAATFTVTTLADSGAGSLRSAITQANATTEADTIQFQNGLQGTIDLSGGALVITESLSIVGPGAGKVTIDANGRSRVFRFNNPQGLERTWAISGLTVTRGLAANGDDDSGGGLFYESTSVQAQITLNNMVFTKNTAARKGGAVSVAGANLTLGNVTLSSNRTQGGFQPSGGGLYFNRGLVRIERSRIIDNSAELIGGGIHVIAPAVSAVITDTLIQGNTASLAGGGMSATTMTSLTISRSAFVGNAVTDQTQGGGLYFSGVTDPGSPENVIENSTFSGNRTQHQFSQGSGLAVLMGNMTVRNSTFAYNATSPDTSPGQDAGGALWVSNGTATRVTVQSTLFSGNTHGNAGLSVDLTRTTGNPASTLNVDHSLFQTSPAIGVVSNPGTGNLEADALLQDLTTTHGGLTPVHPIPANSPAIDAGANPANLATDQRGPGFARTIDFNPCRRPLVHRTDIGAYEYFGDTIFCDGFND